jgi:hypothetical protein
MSGKTYGKLFFPICFCALFFACANSSKEIKSNFVSLLTAVHEDDKEAILFYAPFFSELTEEEEKAMLDLFKEITLAVKTLEVVPGGRRTKNLTVTLPETGIVFTFSFEKQNAVWALTRNVKLKKIDRKKD